MRRNKKGFTLVELLAVIIVLGVIIAIATTSVIKVIKTNRAKTFSKTMDVVVQSAKGILVGKEIAVCDSDPNDCADAFKSKLIESLNISGNDYEISVSYANGEYKIMLTPKDGNFKNMNLNDSELGDGVSIEGKSLIYTLRDTRIVKNSNNNNNSDNNDNDDKNNDSADDKDDPKYDEYIKINGCLTGVGKKDSYDVGDLITFCNKKVRLDTNTIIEGTKVFIKGKSEDFYVIKDNGDTVTLLAKGVLTVGDKVNEASMFKGLQVMSATANFGVLYEDDFKNKYDLSERMLYYKFTEEVGNHGGYKVVFENKNESHKKSTTYSTTYYGHWAYLDSSDNKMKILPKYVADGENIKNVYDISGINDVENYIANYVGDYVNTLKQTFGLKNISGRLATLDELKNLGCVKKGGSYANYEYDCANSPSWVNSSAYWMGSAYGTNGSLVYYKKSNLVLAFNFYEAQAGVRPVIEIDKSELQ